MPKVVVERCTPDEMPIKSVTLIMTHEEAELVATLCGGVESSGHKRGIVDRLFHALTDHNMIKADLLAQNAAFKP